MFFEVWEIVETAGRILAELWWFFLLAIFITSVMSTLRLDTKVEVNYGNG